MATLSTEARNAAVDAVVDLLNAGSFRDRSFVHIFSFGSLKSSNYLGSSHPVWPAAAAGASTAAARSTTITNEIIAVFTDGGTLTTLNILNRDQVNVLLGVDIGDVGSGDEIEMAGSRSVLFGQAITLGPITITMPAS